GRFVARLQGPGISRRAAPQPDRNEQERREARQLAAGSLEPAEQTEGQIDGVGAPLLETLAPLPIEEDELLDVGLRRLVAEEDPLLEVLLQKLPVHVRPRLGATDRGAPAVARREHEGLRVQQERAPRRQEIFEAVEGRTLQPQPVPTIRVVVQEAIAEGEIEELPLPKAQPRLGFLHLRRILLLGLRSGRRELRRKRRGRSRRGRSKRGR